MVYVRAQTQYAVWFNWNLNIVLWMLRMNFLVSLPLPRTHATVMPCTRLKVKGKAKVTFHLIITLLEPEFKYMFGGFFLSPFLHSAFFVVVVPLSLHSKWAGVCFIEIILTCLIQEVSACVSGTHTHTHIIVFAIPSIWVPRSLPFFVTVIPTNCFRVCTHCKTYKATTRLSINFCDKVPVPERYWGTREIKFRLVSSNFYQFRSKWPSCTYSDCFRRLATTTLLHMDYVALKTRVGYRTQLFRLLPSSFQFREKKQKHTHTLKLHTLNTACFLYEREHTLFFHFLPPQIHNEHSVNLKLSKCRNRIVFYTLSNSITHWRWQRAPHQSTSYPHFIRFKCEQIANIVYI